MLDAMKTERLSRSAPLFGRLEEAMRMVHARRVVPFAVALAACVQFACGGEPPPMKTANNAKPTPTATPTTSRLPEKAPDSPTASAVRISDEIVKACGISEPDAYFAFDSSNIRAEDARVLDLVIKCFVSGPLKGRTIKLVGHADPRGGSDYNL